MLWEMVSVGFTSTLFAALNFYVTWQISRSLIENLAAKHI